MFGLSQLIVSPPRITYSNCSIIANILASLPDRVTQRIVIVRLFDHQLIYCRRKIIKTKRGGHEQIKTSFNVDEKPWLKSISLITKTLIK